MQFEMVKFAQAIVIDFLTERSKFKMKPGIIISIVVCVLVACCLFTHRRVLKAWIKHEPMPKAPKWHFWVKNRKS